MKTLTTLKNKAANVITFIEALKSDYTLIDYAIEFLEYSEDEAAKVIIEWANDHHELITLKKYSYSVLVDLVQETDDIEAKTNNQKSDNVVLNTLLDILQSGEDLTIDVFTYNNLKELHFLSDNDFLISKGDTDNDNNIITFKLI